MDEYWSKQALNARTFEHLDYCFQQGACSENVFLTAILFNIQSTHIQHRHFLTSVINRGQLDVNKKIFPEEQTALHVAAEYGAGIYVETLLKHGADVFAQDRLHRYPIDCAIISLEDYIQKKAIRTGPYRYKMFMYERNKTPAFYRNMIANEILVLTNKDKIHAYWLLQCIDDLQDAMTHRLKQKQLMKNNSSSR